MADAIRTFLINHVARRSSESARLLSIALRSFLRFLVLRGEIARDLSGAVPRVRTYQQSHVPVVMSPDDIERVLGTTDRSRPRGRRDYAILLLLARLGLRASEIVALELGDVRWRAGEIVVRGKGPRRDHLPLLADVGEAIAHYLREGRETSDSRRVFLRLIDIARQLVGIEMEDELIIADTDSAAAAQRPVQRMQKKRSPP